MPVPEHLWRLVQTRVDQMGISERAAGRLINMSTREWSYYLKMPRSDVAPHWVLEKFSGLGIPLLQLERAALEDNGWQIVVTQDDSTTWQAGIEQSPDEDGE